MNRNIFEEISPPSHAPNPSAPMLGEAPPPYSTLDPTSGIGEPLFTNPIPNILNSSNSVLDCMDFIPRLLKKRLFGKNDYESFNYLLDRVNRWLEEHCDVQLISCETITLFGQNTDEIFSDNTIFRQSNNSCFLRGLRFWFLKRIIPNVSAVSAPRILKCTTFPLHPTTSFTHLTALLNDQLSKSTPEGQILSVETIEADLYDGQIDGEATYWRRDATTRHQVSLTFRIFTVLSPIQLHETIGYQDFVPSRTNRSKENRGFELFGDVMDRTSRWVARQQGVKFVNVQSINIKIKKNIKFEERCVYTDHGTNPMNFLSILRAYFVVERGGSQPSVEVRLSYRTFQPRLLRGDIASNANMEFENMRQLIDRINKWLKLTGANLFKMETFFMPLYLLMNGEKSLKSEATFSSTKVIPRTGRYIVLVRAYLTGDYVESTEAMALASTS